jgi:hypothetical protein
VIENIIERTLKNIRSQEHTKEAAHQRLLRAGIITKSGKLSRFYRSEINFPKKHK